MHDSRLSMRLVTALGALLVMGGALPAAAQAPADTLPFRPGQWTAVFAANQDLNTLGVQYFRSQRTAWTLDYGVNVERSRVDLPDGESTDGTFSSGVLRLGLRRHAVAQGRAVRFAGGGVLASAGHTRSDQPNGTYRGRALGGGIFGELGAQYHVTRYLGLGAVGTASAHVSDGRHSIASTPAITTRSTTWRFSAGTLRLFGVLLF